MLHQVSHLLPLCSVTLDLSSPAQPSNAMSIYATLYCNSITANFIVQGQQGRAGHGPAL